MKRLYIVSLLTVLTLLLPLVGCGGGTSSSPVDGPPTVSGGTDIVQGATTFVAGGVVFVNPAEGLAMPPIFEPEQIRFINQSAMVNSTDFFGHQQGINWALTADFNPRWNTSATLVLFDGPIDPNVFTVVLQDGTPEEIALEGTPNEVPGATYLYVNNVHVWRVKVLPHTQTLLRSYLCHATWNTVRWDFLPGQAVEAYGYTQTPPYGHGPDELSDFDFPQNHGFTNDVQLDAYGQPAYDLLHYIPYPGDSNTTKTAANQ